MEKLLQSTICFGKFKLSSGEESNYYFDLRKLFSNPDGLEELISRFNGPISTEHTTTHICGVPYGAIPLSTAYSFIYGISQIVLRKEPKGHGRCQLIEGRWKSGDHVILIDDVWTTGSSMLKAKEVLESQGLIVTRMLVVLYRGALEIPKDLEYLFTEYELLRTARFKQQLYNQGNVCFAADLNTSTEIFKKVTELGNSISVLKLHPELIDDWDSTVIAKLRGLAKTYKFWLWADIKICEVPHIAEQQLLRCDWADLVSVMSIVGNETIIRLSKVAKDLDIMLVLVPSLYTEGRLLWVDTVIDYEDTSIVASVGVRIHGLVYIKAGVKDSEELSDVDLVVRGRSLMV